MPLTLDVGIAHRDDGDAETQPPTPLSSRGDPPVPSNSSLLEEEDKIKIIERASLVSSGLLKDRFAAHAHQISIYQPC